MAKNMARIENGVVVNIEWCSDSAEESHVLKNCSDIPVVAGDTYSEGYFYRDGVRLLTKSEAASAQNEDMRNALEILLGGDAV